MSAAPNQPSTRILIVDDHHFVRYSLNVFLESLGHSVFTAEDGADALALLERHEIDLVVTDVHMPVMDGIELTANIRKRFPKIFVIVNSTDYDQTSAALDAGAHLFLAKPYASGQLIAAITALMGSSSA